MKKLTILLLLISIPFTVFGQGLSGTGWLFDDDNDDGKIILFESDQTFTYLNLKTNKRLNRGKVYSGDKDTWTINGNVVVVSFNDGYKIISLTINNNGRSMQGMSINKVGAVNKVTASIIELN